MTLDEALATPGPLVAAWEGWTTKPERRLMVLSVQPKPKLLMTAAVPKDDRDAMSADLGRRGVRVGMFAPHNDHFWCADDQGFTLWSISGGLELEGKAGNLVLADGRHVTAAQVQSVTSFVENEMIHRGVRLELVGGKSMIVADEEDPAAEGDPTYNRDNLSIDAAWVDYLGAALAKWLGKPHVNQVP